MPSIDDLIKQEVNPFDRINLRQGNFWEEQQNAKSIVESIHQGALRQLEEMLDLVAKDHRSRTVLMHGDSGCGKSNLLGRLKQKFNSKAFFVYIGPWADDDYLWRHVLRCTVNSLMKVPAGQTESQLLLWLKNLSAFTKRNLKQKLLVDHFWKILQSGRDTFINHLKQTYQSANIFNSEAFFGILHSLTEPDLYDSACGWLRGDDLSEESMKELKVRFCLDTEDSAKNILANFGKITTITQPIVLCECIPVL